MKKKIIHTVIFLILLFAAERSLSVFLLGGISRFYGVGSNHDILIVGASQTMLGLDKVQLERETGKTVSKYTREGVNVYDMHQMLEHYFRTCKKKPELVIYGVDKYLFTPAGLSENSYTLLYPFMDTPNVGKYVKINASGRDYWLHKYIKLIRFNDLLIGHAARGYLGIFSNFKSGLLNQEVYTKLLGDGEDCFRKLEVNQASLAQFNKTMDFLKEQRVNVLLLCIPYAEPLHSYNLEESEKVMDIFKTCSKRSERVNILMLDELASNPELYADINHLNPEGQSIASRKISAFIKEFCKP
ncbi:MAG: hypothetical protein PUJ61_10215 [Spirochaetia bacterium]|nr:hypothetical protein [Spirochaetia bacterium]